MGRITKKEQMKGYYLRLPIEVVEKVDKIIRNSQGYYSDRSQYFRIAVYEKMRKDGELVFHLNGKENDAGNGGEKRD